MHGLSKIKNYNRLSASVSSTVNSFNILIANTYLDQSYKYESHKIDLKEGEEKSLQAINLDTNKKSTIFVLSLWNLMEVFISRALNVARILALLNQIVNFYYQPRCGSVNLFPSPSIHVGKK